MVLSTVIEPPDTLVATVTGTLTTTDQARLIAWIRAAIRTAGSVHVLLRLDRFAGWAPPDVVDDPATLWLGDDEPVRKMAIVGDGRWRHGVLTMAAQPVRGIPIDYFETETAARAWLGNVSTRVPGRRAASSD
jgi:hypothetical protein